MFEARFQSFDDADQRAATAPRVAALRAELARRGLAGFIVPCADRHQNEYLPPSELRLAWLTGFTGSAGVAIVLADRAAIFVDGRYTLQVRQQVDAAIFTVEHLVETPPDTWIEANLPAGAKLGYDPWLHTVEGAERLAKACAAAGANARADRAQPDRRDLAGSARAPARPSDAARSALRRRGRAREACAHRQGDRQAARRRARGVRSARDRLGVQHPRMRTSRTRPCRSPSRSCRKRAAGALCRGPQARATRFATSSKRWRTCASPPPSRATWRRSAPTSASCGSIRRPRPTRSPASSRRQAARSCAAPIRSSP